MIRVCLCILFLPTIVHAMDRPNVLFIVVDDLRSSLGIFGDKLAITPNIDALGSRGTVFVNAHCQIAICNPSRASVMTGMRPDTIRVWGLSKHFRQEKPDVVTLPQLFRQNGYHTHSIGKIYHGSGEPSKDPPSWSEAPLYDNVRDPKLRYATEANLKGKGHKRAASESASVPDTAYVDGLVSEAAMKALGDLKKQDKSFFLAVGFRKPHLPFSAPKKYWDMYDRAKLAKARNPTMPNDAPLIAGHSWKEVRGYTDVPDKGPMTKDKTAELRHGYYAATSYMDTQVGRLLDELKRLGLNKNTIVCLYGDHGFHLGEHNLWGKLTNYDMGTNAPLLFASPFQKEKGKAIRQTVEFLDIYPTIADLCGLKKPVELEGKSLLPLLDNSKAAAKNFAISQFSRPVSYNYTKKKPKNMGYSIRDDRYRYTKWIEFKSGAILVEEFYDYAKINVEVKNEVNNPQYVSTINRMKKRLERTISNGINTGDRE